MVHEVHARKGRDKVNVMDTLRERWADDIVEAADKLRIANRLQWDDKVYVDVPKGVKHLLGPVEEHYFKIKNIVIVGEDNGN